MKEIKSIVVLILLFSATINLQAQEEKALIKRTVTVNKEFKRLTKGVSGPIDINLPDNASLRIMNKSSYDDTDDHYLFIMKDGEIVEYVKLMIRKDMRPPVYSIEVTDKDDKKYLGAIIDNKMVIDEGVDAVGYGYVLDLLESKAEILKKIQRKGNSYTIK